jgi:hypothetical protein
MSEVELIAIDGVGKAKLKNMVMLCKCHYRFKKQSSKAKKKHYLETLLLLQSGLTVEVSLKENWV